MADTKNSLELMRRNLLRLGVLDRLSGLKPKQLEEPTLRANNPEIFLQLTNYLITEHSPALFSEVIEIVPNIRTLPDKKFMDSCYLVMRDILECIPVITVEQFLTPKFFDLKLQFVADLAKKVYDFDQQHKPKKPLVVKSSELEYQRPTQLKEPPKKRPPSDEEEEEQEEPRVVAVAPTRIVKPAVQKPVQQPRTNPKTVAVRPNRFEEESEPVSRGQQDEASQIHDLYGIVNNLSLTVSELVTKFNGFQDNVVSWVNNINAKVTMLEDKVRVLQTNL